MLYEVYKQVFGNIFLSTQIFKHVHQLQFYQYGLEYDDIVDIGWMYKHNHKGLLKEKLNNSNNYLYMDGEILFTKIANDDTELFITLFERFKHHVLGYYYRKNDNDWSKYLNNFDVVKYLFNRGYGKRIWRINLNNIDINILKYYLENQWLKPTMDLFSYYQSELMKDNRTSRIDLQEKIEMIVKYIEPTKIGENIIRHPAQLLGSLQDVPIPSLIKSISHLLGNKDDVIMMNDYTFQNQQSITIQQAVENVQQAEDHLVKLVQSLGGVSNENSNIKLNHFKFSRVQTDQAPQRPFWPLWVEKTGQEFITSWKESSKRIRVTAETLCFSNLVNGADHQKLKDEHSSFRDIGPFLVAKFMVNVNVQGLIFIYQQGYHAINMSGIGLHMFYQDLVKLTNKQDREAIVGLSNSPFVLGPHLNPNNIPDQGPNVLSKLEILKRCCDGGYYQNLDYYLGKFKDNLELDQQQINYLFARVRLNRYAIGVLYSHGFIYTDKIYDGVEFYIHFWFDKFDKERMKTFLRRLDKPTKRMLLTQLIECIVINNDYVSFKHLMNNFKNNKLTIDPNRSFLSHLAPATNINIIDYIKKNKSTCLRSNVVFKFFFQNLFEMATEDTDFNIPLIQYLLTNNCVDPDSSPSIPAVLESFRSKTRVINLNHFIYIAHRYKYMDQDANTPLTLVEFISRDQQKCNGKLNFKSIYANYGVDKNREKGLAYNNIGSLLVDLTNTYDTTSK
ncbi:hypothetical protein CYY_008021 [Polysphondylium violaceum]|uniref:Uncharacterized protein n=1 Tax=Polysphondylium violaceum TaxID=133409 RepID=A0A8J4PNX4_9MYCE|nr:hypothetical protein CYY_008021 [Polysphondylium violaceum]